MTMHPCDHPPQAAVLPDRPLRGMETDLVDDLLRSMKRSDVLVESVTAGSKFIAVVAGGRMGLASLLGARQTAGEREVLDRAVGRRVSGIAEYLRSPSPFSISLGMAALNAANAPDPAHPPDAGASAETIITELGRGRTVGVVGQFPFVDRLRQKAAALHLFELRDVPGAVDRDQWEAVLPELDVLALTGTALLTRQMAWFLTRAGKAAVVVLGPTTPLSPALFRVGADYLCGSIVTDAGLVSNGVREGMSFRTIKKTGGIRFVQMTCEKTDHGMNIG